MKIPLYVEMLIQKRQKLAEELMVTSAELDTWLEKNGLPTGTDYTCTGCMIYCEPAAAAQCVRLDILHKGE